MFPTLHTERLLLREIVQEDIHLIFKGFSNPQVIKHFGISFPTLEATREQMDWYADMIKNDTGRCWCICSTDNTIFFGVCTLNFWKKEHRRIETGYWIFPEYWGKGIVPEALNRIFEYGFKEMNLHRISAEVEDDNLASKAVLKKMGFLYEGTLRDYEIKEDRFINLEIHALIRKEV